MQKDTKELLDFVVPLAIVGLVIGGTFYINTPNNHIKLTPIENDLIFPIGLGILSMAFGFYRRDSARFNSNRLIGLGIGLLLIGIISLLCHIL